MSFSRWLKLIAPRTAKAVFSASLRSTVAAMLLTRAYSGWVFEGRTAMFAAALRPDNRNDR
ncbi:hypothetical protein DLREEDagr8_35370 [Dongia sp. agr-C8]